MKKTLFLLAIIYASITYSQEPVSGNVITNYGKTYPIESPGFKTDTLSKLKVVFDINRSFDASQPNKLIETAARYLNMHERAGAAPENMEISLVIHGKAVQDMLKDEYYTAKFPSENVNPNLPLLEALADNGVQIIICGQSATHYNVKPENSDPHTKFALSAMTALVQLQNENYRLINF